MQTTRTVGLENSARAADETCPHISKGRVSDENLSILNSKYFIFIILLIATVLPPLRLDMRDMGNVL